MTEAEQTAVTFKRLAVTLDVLIERVRRTGATTPLHVLQAAEQLGVEAELRELSDLLIAARHAFVVEGPADEWHVLHPPMCETIKSVCPYESADRVRADRPILGRGTYEVRLEPGDVCGPHDGAVLVIGDTVA